MKKTERNFNLLVSMFVTSLIISNVVTAKVINLGFNLFGQPVLIPGAVLCYAFTFLATDVIGELWGKERSNFCVFLGFVCQLFSLSLITITNYLPAFDPNIQKSYTNLLGQNYIFVLGSLISYSCSQSWDVWIFHKIRTRVVEKQGSNKNRWLWNNLSTMTSQIIDTVIFIGFSFGVGFGWLFDGEKIKILGVMVLGQYLTKFVLALLDTPLFYLLTRKVEQEKTVK